MNSNVATLPEAAVALATSIVETALSEADTDWKARAISREIADVLKTGGDSKAVLLALTVQHLATVITAVCEDQRGAA